MRLHFCGVRGSVPATGSEFAEVGGNTSCVALSHDGAPPSLVLDAGTGIRRLGSILGAEPFDGTILLGHLHWDHTMGLPFFAAGDRPDARVRLLLPEQGADAGTLLAQAMSPPHFPIAPDGLCGDWTFATIDEGRHRIEEFDVLVREIPHKGGRTFGFRIADDAGATIAYLSDHAPQRHGWGPGGIGAYHDAAVELTTGADILIHDAHYRLDELPARASHGHSAADYAAALGRRVGVRQVMLFHHDPARTDTEVGDLLEEVRSRYPDIAIDVATESTVIDI